MKRDGKGWPLNARGSQQPAPLQSQKCERIQTLNTKARIHIIIPQKEGIRHDGRVEGSAEMNLKIAAFAFLNETRPQAQ
jgi:hypothetical protein